MVQPVISDWAIFLYVQIVFISISFWESHIDPFGWGRTQQGWKINLFVRQLTAYHFWAWLVCFPLFLVMPLVMYGWDWRIFWLLLASALVGTVIEDTLWFALNPRFTMAKWNSKHADWHHWIKIGKFELPEFIIILPIVAFFIWWFLVRV